MKHDVIFRNTRDRSARSHGDGSAQAVASPAAEESDGARRRPWWGWPRPSPKHGRERASHSGGPILIPEGSIIWLHVGGHDTT